MDLRKWNVKQVRLALDSAPAFAPFPSDGRSVVELVGNQTIQQLHQAAAADALASIPALPAELYLQFQRTGVREGYEDAQRQRRNMLYRLTLAEWLGGKGAFTAAAENIAWARLEETNWAWPAHARTLRRYLRARPNRMPRCRLCIGMNPRRCPLPEPMSALPERSGS